MGKIIVIDGLDGCGKATQVEELRKSLSEMGYIVHKADFPNYNSLSSGPVRMYLGGDITSDPNLVNPYLASMFYSVDRGITYLKDLRDVLNNNPNAILLLDRYISANIIYQGSKFDNLQDRHEYFKWEYEMETKYLGIPKEDITIALTLPIEISQKLMSQRYHGNDTMKDIHEANLSFLARCASCLDDACAYLPTVGYNWVRLDCSNSDNWIADRHEITEKLLSIIKPIIEAS